MAITKGDLAAVDARLRDGSVGETSMPIYYVSVEYLSCVMEQSTYNEGAAEVDC